MPTLTNSATNGKPASAENVVVRVAHACFNMLFKYTNHTLQYDMRMSLNLPKLCTLSDFQTV